MDGDVGELGDLVQHPVLRLVGDVVSGDQVERLVHDDAGVRADPVADPPQPDVLDVQHTGGGADGVLCGRGERRVDRVHQASVDVTSSTAQHDQDGDGDQQTYDRVGQREAEQDAGGPQDHGERGEAVGTCVEAIGD